MNFKLTLQYDGTDFHGWQMQGERRTVQGELTRVLTLLEGSAVVVHGSGRTDAGVHAEGQVANVHLERDIKAERLRGALNGNLLPDVRVMEACVAADDFHARYSARGKTYVYRILNAPVMSPFWKRYALHEARPLDVERMARAARLFPGRHDWSAFSTMTPDISDRRRTITNLEVTEQMDVRAGGRLIEIRATAEGFLRYMVRMIAGTLLAAGRQELDEEGIARAVNHCDRTYTGATAPAHGLTLVKVHY